MSKILRIIKRVAGVTLGVSAAMTGVPLPAAVGRYVALAGRIASVTENAVLNAEVALQGDKRGPERLPLVVDEMSRSMGELNELLVELKGERLVWPVDMYERYVAAEVARMNALAEFKSAIKTEKV